MIRLGGGGFLLICAGVAWAQPSSSSSSSSSSPLAAAVAERAARSHAYEFLEELCDDIGGRLTGSAEEKKAREWTMAKLRALGLQNVREERFPIARGWERISARAELRLPGRQALTISSLGWAGSTAAGGVEATVVAVNRKLLAGEAANAARWKGRILLVAPPIGETADELEVAGRMGPFLKLAQASGALAVIDAQPRAGMNLTGVDLADLRGDYVPIPVVRMASDHHAILSRLLRRGRSVRVWMEVQNRVSPGPAETGNVMGEIRGRAQADDVVLAVAHLDSWDLGQGAGDDGFGVAALLGAAEAIAQAKVQQPRRTIRFLFTSGEEQGVLGARAYVEKHRAEMSAHVAAVVADMGYGKPLGWMLNGREELVAAVRGEAAGLVPGAPMKVTGAPYLLGDSIIFTLAGVAAMDMWQDASGSSVSRHSLVDTFDKVKAEDLQRAVQAVAGVMVWMADRPERLATRLSPEQTRALIEKIQVGVFLRLLNLSPIE